MTELNLRSNQEFFRYLHGLEIMSDRDQKSTLSERLGRATDQASSLTGQRRSANDLRSEVGRLLSGNLKDKPMSWLLEVANHYKASGTLNIGSLHHITIIVLEDGRPVHAKSQLCKGTEAILEMFVMKEGKVKFDDTLGSEEHTIKESAQELITLGEEYSTSIEFMQKNQVNESSILTKEFDDIDDDEIKRILNKGVKFDPTIQLEFYKAACGSKNIKQIADSMFLPRSIWFVVSANLLRLGLLLPPSGRSLKTEFDMEFESTDEVLREIQGVTVADEAFSPVNQNPQKSTGQTNAAELIAKTNSLLITSGSGTVPKIVALGAPSNLVKLNGTRSVIARARMIDDETGIFDSDIFQFFLEKEFKRAFRFSSDFTLLVFCITTDQHRKGNLPQKALAYLLSTVHKIGRDVDLLGQLGDKVFGFLLPQVDSVNAIKLAERIDSKLPELAPELAEWKPKLYFGVASVPRDAKDLTSLVEASQLALVAAVERDKSYLRFDEV